MFLFWPAPQKRLIVLEQTQADSSDFGAVQENFIFEPVVIAPGDKAIADKAPEGMVFIKGGCFILGNNFAQVDEAPEHEVCVDDFYLDKYEVTQARWEKVMGFNPSKFPAPDQAGRADHFL